MEVMEPGMSSNLAGSLAPTVLVQSVAAMDSTLYTPMWLLALATIMPSPLALKAVAVRGEDSCSAQCEQGVVTAWEASIVCLQVC